MKIIVDYFVWRHVDFHTEIMLRDVVHFATYFVRSKFLDGWNYSKKCMQKLSNNLRNSNRWQFLTWMVPLTLEPKSAIFYVVFFFIDQYDSGFVGKLVNWMGWISLIIGFEFIVVIIKIRKCLHWSSVYVVNRSLNREHKFNYYSALLFYYLSRDMIKWLWQCSTTNCK